MEKHTLYDALRHLMYLISLYGFNESKPHLKCYNRMAKIFAAFSSVFATAVMIFVFVFVRYYGEKRAENEDRENRALLFLKLMFGANISCFLLCHFRKRKFEALLKQLEGHWVSENFYKKIRKFQWCFGLFFLDLFLYICARLRSKEDFCSVCSTIGPSFFYYFLTHCLPLCALPVCLVAYYIRHTLSERVEEIKKSKSLLRKTRLTTRLLLLSTRLNILVKATNEYGAPLMLLMKVTVTMTSVLAIYLTVFMGNDFGSKKEVAIFFENIPFLLSFLFYGFYLRVAPSANRTPSLMARVMVENLLRDDRGMSREAVSSFPSLRTRLAHLAHLTHSRLNQERFTVLGEPIVETDLTMTLVKLVGDFNTINSVLW